MTTIMPIEQTKRSAPNPMPVLYRRLKVAGYDKSFVRKHFLPKWWDDALAVVPANMAIAEIAISRLLDYRLSDLRNPDGNLPIEPAAEVRYKRVKGTEHLNSKPLVRLAQSAARTIVKAIEDLPPFDAISDPLAIRSQILQGEKTVSLDALVNWSWRNGIVVFHMDHRPKDSKKFMGLAFFCDTTPIIALAWGLDSPPAIAFHLAHELAHIMRGDVKPGGPQLLDYNGSDEQEKQEADSDPVERDANEFAMTLLTGDPHFTLRLEEDLTGDRLAYRAAMMESTRQINRGTYALAYGKSTGRWGVANNALKRLRLDHGAHEEIYRSLTQWMRPDRSETERAVLSILYDAAESKATPALAEAS